MSHNKNATTLPQSLTQRITMPMFCGRKYIEFRCDPQEHGTAIVQFESEFRRIVDEEVAAKVAEIVAAAGGTCTEGGN